MMCHNMLFVFFFLVVIQSVISPQCRVPVTVEGVNEDEEDLEKKKKLEQDVMKYAEVLQCQMCEVAIEAITLIEYRNRDANTNIDKKDKHQRALLETRNYEIVEEICEKMKNDAEKQDDKGTLGMILLHCPRIIENMGPTFVKYLSKLQDEKRPLIARKPKPKSAAQKRREEAEGISKEDIKDNVKLKYANETEVDEMCESLCPVKTSLKTSMNKAKESMKLRHESFEMKMKAYLYIFKKSMGIIAGYWYIIIGGFLMITILFTWIQWKMILKAKRNAHKNKVKEH